MMKKIPNFMSNSELEVSNSCYQNNDFVIGDTENVLDIKNQYLIHTYFATNDEFESIEKVNKIKNLSCASIVGDGEEEYLAGYCDYTIYPLIDIKIKGSGIRDILKKNNHAPTGFFLIHDTTEIDRRNFDLYDNFFNFIKKKYLKKSIKITSKSICFAPKYDSELIHFYDHPMQSDGKRLVKPFEEFDKEGVKSFQEELNKLKKQKKRMEEGSIVKYTVDNGTYDVFRPEYNGGGLIFVLKK
jgi:hypothetical protein